jgi:hypothetical protein
VKKLAIVLLFVVAGCRRQVVVTSAPTSTTSTTPITSGSTGGAASATDALRQFLTAAVAQDVQAMVNVWGTKQGSIRKTVPMDEVEKRAIYMMRCLRHDTYVVLNESPAAGGERAFMVQLKKATLAPSGMFTTTPGPEGRWYVSQLDLPAFSSLCTAK